MGITIKKDGLVIFALLAVVVFTITACSGEKNAGMVRNGDGSKIFRNRVELLRDYAFCSCLEYSFKKDSLQFKDDSRATLYDLSNDDLIIDKKGVSIDSFAKKYVDRISSIPGQTYENRKSRSFQCLLFYRSKELKGFIKSLLR